MNSDIKKTDENEVMEISEDLFMTEYNFTKYILTLIPIYLSCLFFVFLDGSFLGMLKIISGYTVVFSMFIISSEEMYFLIKRNISRLLIAFSLTVGIIFVGSIILYLSDLYLIQSVNETLSLVGIHFNPLHFIMGVGNKIIFGSFLVIVTIWINILILALLIKFNVANKILQKSSSEQ